MDDDRLIAAARAIYDAIYLPGQEEGDGSIAVPFEVSQREGLGSYDRALCAARSLRALFPNGI